MKSFIKIYGPPVLKAIKTLEKVSIGMPEVCIMDTIIAQSGPLLDMRYEEPSGLVALGRSTILVPWAKYQ